MSQSLALELISELEDAGLSETLKGSAGPPLCTSRVKEEKGDGAHQPEASAPATGTEQEGDSNEAEQDEDEDKPEEIEASGSAGGTTGVEPTKKEEEDDASQSEREQADYETDSPQKRQRRNQERNYEDLRVRDPHMRRVGVNEAQDTESEQDVATEEVELEPEGEQPPSRREPRVKGNPKGGKAKGKSKAPLDVAEKYFTVDCRHYMRAKGGCRRGDRCTFVHDYKAAGRASCCYSCGDPDGSHRPADCPTLANLTSQGKERILGWHAGPKGKESSSRKSSFEESKGKESSRRPSFEEEGKGKLPSSKEKGKTKKGSKEGKSKPRDNRGEENPDEYSYCEYYSNYDYEDSEQNPEARRSSEEERPPVRLKPKEPEGPPLNRGLEAGDRLLDP